MSTNTKISTPIIKKFDGENYHLWAFKMKCYLMAKSLWEYVDPDPNTGITTMTAENGDFFRKAHAALILHLPVDQYEGTFDQVPTHCGSVECSRM